MPNPSNISYSVNSIADLKNLTGAFDNESILLLGYYSINDGGGGEFYWNSSSVATDDGGAVIQATGIATGRWLRIFPDRTSNVKWFGAKGNGSTSDTTFIQATINTAYGIGVNTIYIPEGNYIVDSQIFVYGNISIYGNPGKSVFRFNGAFGGDVGGNNKFVFILGLSAKGVVNTWTNSYIRDLSFIGNAGAAFYYAINTFSVNNVCFENLIFNWTNIDKTAGYGTSIEGLNDSSWSTGTSRSTVKILNCVVLHKQDSVGAEGVGQSSCDNLEISGCRIYGVGDDSIGIHACTNVIVKNNKCYSTDGRIYISNSQNVLVEGNHVERIQTQISHVWISGGALIMCEIEGTDNPLACSNIKVVDNTLVLPAGMTGTSSTYMARFRAVQGLICSNNIFEANSDVTVSCINIEPQTVLTTKYTPVNHIISNNIAKGAYPPVIRENGALSTDIVGPVYYSNNNATYSIIGTNSNIVGQIFGSGIPESVISAPVGTLYIDRSGIVNNLWYKLSGRGNTGWSQFLNTLGASGIPAITAGAGAGTSPIVSIEGGDKAGLITITVGSAPAASATVVTLTYSSGVAFSIGSYPVICAANGAAAALSGNFQVYVNGTTTSFLVIAGPSGLSAGTQYMWHYHVF